MFTIYTFGDPELLREALLALATVFGLSEWWDAGSGFGAGGNLLAAALIGLLAVAIAGITSQQIRLDYLLVALIIFGVAFGSKTSVQIEDIQTGTSYVVADIPIGIAAVAGASSSAARNLTETMGTALQRPGTTTSLLTDSGFLDPLRILYGLRNVAFQELDPLLSKSLLEYYRRCVGRTMEYSPGLFNEREFISSSDPVGYLLNTANVLNWSTVYYNDANPEGIAQSCHATAPMLSGDIGDLTSASSNEALAKLRLSMGNRLTGAPFDFVHLDDAANVLTRATFSGQQFMTNAAMRNFHNLGEAWRLAEYGSSQAMYAVNVTGALEQQRGAAAVQGTVFLNMMFPLMTFFQFVFIAMAPFIALIVVASPFTATKTIGGYALFGVWTYSWMPIAAVINHYIQINIGEVFEGADVAAAGASYLAIIGMDDFYNQVANQLTIGSNALAAAPLIVGAVLFGSFQSLTSLGGQFSKAQAPTKVSSTVSAPTLTSTDPFVSGGAGVSLPAGLRPGPGARVFANSRSMEIGGGNLLGSNTTSGAVENAAARATTASRALQTTTGRVRARIAEFSKSGRVGTTNVSDISARTAESAVGAISKGISIGDLQSLNYQQLDSLATRLGVDTGRFMVGAGINAESLNRSGNTEVMEQATRWLDENKAAVMAEMTETLATQYANNQEVAGAFRDLSQGLAQSQEEQRRAEEYREEATARAAQLAQVGRSVPSGSAYTLFRDQLVGARSQQQFMDNVYADLSRELGSDYNDFLDEARTEYARLTGNPQEWNYDKPGTLVAMNEALNNRAARGEEGGLGAIQTMWRAMGIGGAGRASASADGLRDEVSEGIASIGGNVKRSQANMAMEDSDVRFEAQSRIDRAGERPTVTSDDREVLSGVFSKFLVDRNLSDNQALRGQMRVARAEAEGARSVTNSGITRSTLEFIQGQGGFAGSINNLSDGFAPGISEGERANAFANARGALMHEVASAGGRRRDVQDTYEGFRAAGMEDGAATVATFGVFGPRRPGAGGFAGPGIVAAVVAKDFLQQTAADRAAAAGNARPRAISMTRFMQGAGRTALGAAGAKVAIPAVLAATGIAGAYTVLQNGENYNSGVDALREVIKKEFAMANSGNQQLVSDFSAAVDRAETTEDLVELVKNPQFAMSEQQLNGIESEMNGPERQRAIDQIRPQSW